MRSCTSFQEQLEAAEATCQTDQLLLELQDDGSLAPADTDRWPAWYWRLLLELIVRSGAAPERYCPDVPIATLARAVGLDDSAASRAAVWGTIEMFGRMQVCGRRMSVWQPGPRRRWVATRPMATLLVVWGRRWFPPSDPCGPPDLVSFRIGLWASGEWAELGGGDAADAR